MKIYSPHSALTIRQRIEKAYRQKRKNDLWVNVHNNGTSDGTAFGFFLTDWESEEFQSYTELDFRLDNESQSAKSLSLGFNYRRTTSEEALKDG